MRMRHDLRLFLLALLAGFPAVVTAIALLWTGDRPPRLEWTLTAVVVGFWLGAAEAMRARAIFPLHTLSNLLAALREGDYSLRARGARHDDALGEVLWEINSLGATLREQRLGALEATALLEKIMAEVDVAVFAFDPDLRLHLINRAGERLLAGAAADLLGRPARGLGLDECLGGPAARTLRLPLPGGAGPWEMRRGTFRERGREHRLLVLTDLGRALRAEERQAWRRLIRVLGHELNNSLAPIQSLAHSLAALLARSPAPPDWREDMTQGLGVIAGRAEALGRFMRAYTQWAKLPRPTLAPLALAPLIRRVAGLETLCAVAVAAGPDLTLLADADQLEQALINLVKNAAEAVAETARGAAAAADSAAHRSAADALSVPHFPPGAAPPRVEIGWRERDGRVEINVDDEGPGLGNSANLFVPFFTTKPSGSGIGLLVARQIAEAHGGDLSLANRAGGGCRARLRLPLPPPGRESRM